MTSAEREVLEYYAGLIRLPVRYKSAVEVARYHGYSWSPIESAIDERSATVCESRGWLSPMPERRTTSLGILALGQLS